MAGPNPSRDQIESTLIGITIALESWFSTMNTTASHDLYPRLTVEGPTANHKGSLANHKRPVVSYLKRLKT